METSINCLSLCAFATLRHLQPHPHPSHDPLHTVPVGVLHQRYYPCFLQLLQHKLRQAPTIAPLLTSSPTPPAAFTPALRGSNTGTTNQLLPLQPSDQSTWIDAPWHQPASLAAPVPGGLPPDECNSTMHIFSSATD
jgi:hypothetical protein